MTVHACQVDAVPEDGKASSIQFLLFPFTVAQTKAVEMVWAEVLLAFCPKGNGHVAKWPKAVRGALAGSLA